MKRRKRKFRPASAPPTDGLAKALNELMAGGELFSPEQLASALGPFDDTCDDCGPEPKRSRAWWTLCDDCYENRRPRPVRPLFEDLTDFLANNPGAFHAARLGFDALWDWHHANEQGITLAWGERQAQALEALRLFINAYTETINRPTDL